MIAIPVIGVNGNKLGSHACGNKRLLYTSFTYDILVYWMLVTRFKKSAQTGVTADVKAKEKMATLQRDSRPLLYKFHEVLFQTDPTTYCVLVYDCCILLQAT